jgi:hypothetical protein
MTSNQKVGPKEIAIIAIGTVGAIIMINNVIPWFVHNFAMIVLVTVLIGFLALMVFGIGGGSQNNGSSSDGSYDEAVKKWHAENNRFQIEHSHGHWAPPPGRMPQRHDFD